MSILKLNNNCACSFYYYNNMTYNFFGGGYNLDFEMRRIGVKRMSNKIIIIIQQKYKKNGC